MGMCSYVHGFRPPDEKYFQMKAIWEACEKAKITPPREVNDFFEAQSPNDNGVLVELPKECYCDWVDPNPNAASQGIEVDLTKLPKDVTVIRFINSW